MTRDELLKWLGEQLHEVLGVDQAELSPDTNLIDDLDADSIDLIEVVNAAERRFDVVIEEQELYEITTLGQFVDVLAAAGVTEG